MLKTLLRMLSALSLFGATTLPALAANPRVLLETSLGKITLELEADKAPKSVANFLRYVDEGFYAGTVFHRVIDGFMVQGGGLGKDLQRKETHESVANEADNGLKNRRGTLALARTNQPDSATSQFFINLVDNAFLDFRERTPRGWGYAVFGRVVEGMDVVDRMAKLPTGVRPDGMRDVPVDPPLIQRITRVQIQPPTGTTHP